MKMVKLAKQFDNYRNNKYIDMKKTIILSSILLSSLAFKAQSNKALWKEINESDVVLSGKRDIIPEKYKTFHLDLNALKTTLASAPLDKTISVENSAVIISLPMPNGLMQDFKLTESPVMEDPLQMSFPEIRTYNVKGIDDKYASIIHAAA